MQISDVHLLDEISDSVEIVVRDGKYKLLLTSLYSADKQIVENFSDAKPYKPLHLVEMASQIIIMFHCALVLFAVEVRRGFVLYKFKSKDAIYHTADSNLKKEGERI